MFGKISVIVTLRAGERGGDVKKNFIVRKYYFIIRNI